MNEAVAAQVRARREQRGISAAELARRAGISKAALSGIEAGRGNPTLDTLDALAAALAVPLADLLQAPESEAATVVKGRPADDKPISQQLLHRVAGSGLEVWRLRMLAGETFDGVPHAAGTVEQLFVVAGALQAGPTDDTHDLHPGDLIAFAGNQAHTYLAGNDGADVLVIFATTS